MLATDGVGLGTQVTAVSAADDEFLLIDRYFSARVLSNQHSNLDLHILHGPSQSRA
jgi:hypothetical protein